MSILFNFVLNIIAVSFLVSLTDAFGVICKHSHDDDFILIPNIPESCEYILYSHQYIGSLNRNYDANIRTLAKKNPVFVEVSISMLVVYIRDLVDDPNYQPTIDFLAYLDALNISGILLNMVDIQAVRNSIEVEDVQKFLSILKNNKPKLKIGLMIEGYKYATYRNETKKYKFDLLNELLNFYYIDSSGTADVCNKNSSIFGRFRTSKSEITQIKKLAEVVNESKMEKSKTVIDLNISVTNTRGTLGDLTTYGQYCKSNSREDTTKIWCAESLTQVYNLANYLKSYFGGFALSNFNKDDFENTCKCGVFPVSKAFTQGWNSGERPNTCSAISGPAV